MKRYHVPARYRRGVFAALDRRLKRSLTVCSFIGMVIALLLTIVTPKKMEMKPRRLIPKERVARVLTPKKPAPPRKVQAPPPKPLPKEPPKVAKSTEKRETRAESKPKKPTSKSRTPKPGGKKAARDPNVGKKGREAGQKVAKEVRKATASIDNLLSSMSGTLPVKAPKGDGGGQGKTEQKYSVVGGRGGEKLASIEGTLESTGAGRGAGSSRGVAKEGIDVVDEGVKSSGDESALWGRDSRSLMAVVQRYKAGVKFCYDNALKKQKGLSGKITLQMDIAPSGAVRNLRVVSDTLNNPSMARCIKTQVQKWRFERIEEGTVRFTLPLVFTPPNG